MPLDGDKVVRAFLRVGSPSAQPGRDALKGDGHSRGTRRADNADFPVTFLADFLMRKTVLLTPSWVKTEATSLGNDQPAELGAEQEIFGTLVRSFQTWTDAPGLQWHIWYDWNLHVKPAADFAWLMGEANRIELGEPKGAKQLVQGAMECEWDTGGFGPKPGPMFNQNTSNIDWAWPMTGDDVWVAGRSIYDGGHETIKGGTRLTRSELHPCKAVANVRREAFAFPENGHFTPAVQFVFFASRLGGYVDFDLLGPAPDQDDYEFLVDLLPCPDEVRGDMTLPVGATPDFPLNRVVLRPPALLVDLNFQAHQTATGRKLPPAALKRDFAPVIEIVTPDRARPLEQQARIVIPLKQLRAKHPEVDSYGVIVSFGWDDASKTQGKRVKKCTVQFQNAHAVSLGARFNIPPFITDTNSDFLGSDEWRFKTCVNNRWFQWEAEDIVGESNVFSGNIFKSDVPLPHPPLVFHLDEKDTIKVHAHGASLNLMDDFIKKETGKRQITFNELDVLMEASRKRETVGRPPTAGRPTLPPSTVAALTRTTGGRSPPRGRELLRQVGVTGQAADDLLAEIPADWKKDIDPQAAKSSGTFAVQRVLARQSFSKLAGTLKDENHALGICDPGRGFESEKKINPLPLDHPKLKEGQAAQFTLRGVLLVENEELAELFEPERLPVESLYDRGGKLRKQINYELTYTVQVEPQFP